MSWFIIQRQRASDTPTEAAEAATKALADVNAALASLRAVAAQINTDRAAIDVTRQGVAFDAGRVSTMFDLLLPSEAADLTPEQRAIMAVDIERNRRLATFSFTFDNRKYQSRDQDFINYGGAATAASIALMNGAQEGDFRWADPSKDFEWITTDNALIKMDAPTMVRLGQAAMAWRDAHIKAGRLIKDTKPVPANYKDDALWPPK